MERPATPDRTDLALGGEVLPPGAEPLQAGDPPVIDGHRLIGRLAAGGTSVVYLAHGPEGEPVALKTTRARQADQTQARRRLRTEAASSRRLPPFCTARLLADGSHHTPPYLVSEYVDGPSLAQYVEFLGPLDAEQLRALASALARAVAAVHGTGLVHCDLQPGNILLASDGPRVIDFSIAQETTPSGRATGAGTVPYNPGWVAPERLTGRPATPATDVFGWGCLIGYAATGRSPFDGEDVGAGHWSVARSADLATIEEPLRTLVEAALAIDPADRPSTSEITARLGGLDAYAPEALPPRHEPAALPAWSDDPVAAAEPYAREDLPPARPPVDEPTTPMARITPEPVFEPVRETYESGYEPARGAAYETPFDAGYESAYDTGYEAPPGTGHEAPYETGYEAPYETGYRAPVENDYETPHGTGYEAPFESGYGAGYETGPTPTPETMYETPASLAPPAEPDLPPRPAGPLAGPAGDETAYVPGFGGGAPVGDDVPVAAFGPRNGHRERRPRRLRTVAMVTAPAALVAVLATVIAMASTGTGKPTPADPAAVPTMGQEQDQAPADSPPAVRPHRRSHGPRPASSPSARDGAGPPVTSRRPGAGHTKPGSPGHSHRPGSPPATHTASPPPTHPASPSPTPSPSGSGAAQGGTSPTG